MQKLMVYHPAPILLPRGDHPVYKTLKEEDRNVDFGNNFVIPNLVPPVCVGDMHTVPTFYSLYPVIGDGPVSAGLDKPFVIANKYY